jgi:hypothetical protein
MGGTKNISVSFRDFELTSCSKLGQVSIGNPRLLDCPQQSRRRRRKNPKNRFDSSFVHKLIPILIVLAVPKNIEETRAPTSDCLRHCPDLSSYLQIPKADDHPK